MEERNVQIGQLMENEDVRKFMQLLMDCRPAAGQDYSMMAWQVDSMSEQLATALQQLGEVRAQLAGMQEHPAKRFAVRTVHTAEERLHQAQRHIRDVKVQIAEGAKKAVGAFKRIGVKALYKAVSILGIKKALEHIQKSFAQSVQDIKSSIGKIESIGRELRSAGGHMKNAGRAVIGKEQKIVDGGREGRFQSAVLAPLRLEKKILTRLNNLALAAVGSMERLERAAGYAAKETAPETGVWQTGEPGAAEGRNVHPEKKSKKDREKPSLLKDIREGKTQAAAASPAVPEKDKRQRAQAAL